MINENQSMDIPRSELIAKLREFIKDAQQTPIATLCEKGDYTLPEARYPQTKGEQLVDSMSTLLVTQSWIDGESEPVLDEMLSVLGPLDIDVNQPESWLELFNLAREL